MRLGARIRSLDFASLFFLAVIAGVGALHVYGLLMHLTGSSGGLIEPAQGGWESVWEGLKLILYAAGLVALIVTLRRWRLRSAGSWQAHCCLVCSTVMVFLSAILWQGLHLVAAFSLTTARRLEPVVFAVGIVASLLILCAFARGEISLRKEQGEGEGAG